MFKSSLHYKRGNNLKKKLQISFIKENLFIILYLTGYFFISILFLTKYPFMHSDESWLSGLSRTMMYDGLGSTEYFFDLVPRYPHAIKIIFHILQIVFIKLFGYSLFSVRLLSLVFGIISLVFIYKISTVLSGSKRFAVASMVIVSFDVQFIYASHFARQEIIILAFMLAAVFYVMSRYQEWKMKNDIITGLIVGLSAGIHPNSFLVALVVGAVYLYYIMFEQKIKIKNLICLVFVTAAVVSLFVGVSYIFDRNFINDYLKYGDDLGTTSGIIMKFFSFPGYYRRLYNTFSVTYYTPDVRFQFVLFASGLAAGIASLFARKYKNKALLFILPVLFLNAGYLVLGRFSQPGIILLFPLCYLLIFLLLEPAKRIRFIALAVLGAAVAVNTAINVYPQINNDYKEYINEIESSVPENSAVLANLNSEYAFEYNALYDYRNLSELGGMSFEEYIVKNNIKYIIYPEEMDFIYNNRPVWNVMYGNISPYYKDMTSFLTNKCKLIHQFSSPYAMRIYMYAYNKDWTVKIYEVTDYE